MPARISTTDLEGTLDSFGMGTIRMTVDAIHAVDAVRTIDAVDAVRAIDAVRAGVTFAQLYAVKRHLEQRKLALLRIVNPLQAQLGLNGSEDVLKRTLSTLSAVQIHQHEEIAITVPDQQRGLTFVKEARPGTYCILRSVSLDCCPPSGTTTSLTMMRSWWRRPTASCCKIFVAYLSLQSCRINLAK